MNENELNAWRKSLDEKGYIFESNAKNDIESEIAEKAGFWWFQRYRGHYQLSFFDYHDKGMSKWGADEWRAGLKTIHEAIEYVRHDRPRYDPRSAGNTPYITVTFDIVRCDEQNNP
jgi:hypothetical protein